jgi:hypothetical protein
MSYKDFNIKTLSEKLSIEQKKSSQLIPDDVVFVQASTRLLSMLEASKKMVITTEKAVCEYIISPILMEIKLNNLDKIEMYSGEFLNVDKNKGLNGEVDFIFAQSPQSYAIKAPVFCITEAKIGRLDRALPQAIAQMCGARLFNERENKFLPIIYGAVTDGNTWRFIRLERQIAYVDEQTYYLDNLPKLLGTLQWVVDFYFL